MPILDSSSQMSLVGKKCVQIFCSTEQQTKGKITEIDAKGTMLGQLFSIMVFSRFNNFEIPVTLHILLKNYR